MKNSGTTKILAKISNINAVEKSIPDWRA